VEFLKDNTRKHECRGKIELSFLNFFIQDYSKIDKGFLDTNLTSFRFYSKTALSRSSSNEVYREDRYKNISIIHYALFE